MLGHASVLSWRDIFVDSPLISSTIRETSFFGNQIQTRAYHYQFAQGVHPNQYQGHLVIVDPIHDQIEPFANLSHRYHIDFQRPLQFSLISHPKYHHPHIPLRLTFVSPSLDPSMEFGQRLKKNL